MPQEWVALLVVLGFVLLVFLAVSQVSRSRKQRAEIARMLGFTSLGVSENWLLSRIAKLYDRYDPDDLKLQDAFQRASGDFKMFWFDLSASSRNESSQLVSNALCLTSPDLTLPEITIFPRFKQSGMMGQLVDQAMQKLLQFGAGRMGEVQVRFPGEAWFEEKFIVLAEDDIAVQELLDPMRLKRLSQAADGLEVHAEGDTLLVRRIIPEKGKDALTVQRELVQRLQTLYEILR